MIEEAIFLVIIVLIGKCGITQTVLSCKNPGHYRCQSNTLVSSITPFPL